MLVAQEDNADSGTPRSQLSVYEQQAAGAMKGARARKSLESRKVSAYADIEAVCHGEERSGDDGFLATTGGKFPSPPN